MNPKMSPSELIAALGAAKQKASNAYMAYKQLKNAEDALRYELELKLKAEGLKSAKGKDFTASIVEKPTVIIKDEAAVIGWLREAPNIEADLYIGLKSTEFNSLAQSMLKGTGELIEGTAVEVKESLSIRANAKPKKVQG